ncbi:hypothetical protein ONE63_009946 [Megalurothrips usitatus]|uniref:Uncharacterized protein n=1 Tax=Megalurothrips usitatus TaxID=439358 RepID=A0AAV7XKF7_9NEOP|nr:hypothetical protein ONE63_009946 [Megalurothrips usitatus]
MCSPLPVHSTLLQPLQTLTMDLGFGHGHGAGVADDCWGHAAQALRSCIAPDEPVTEDDVEEDDEDEDEEEDEEEEEEDDDEDEAVAESGGRRGRAAPAGRGMELSVTADFLRASEPLQ